LKISAHVIEKLFQETTIARLATINSDGSPHQVPIVFTWQEGCFWSPIDGKPKQNSQLKRIRNIETNSRASLIIDRYSDDWSQLWWIRADLDISIILIDETSMEMHDSATKAVTSLERKYPQYEYTPVLAKPPTLLRMRPSRLTSWSAVEVTQ
jgi:PPOX class probable F420-dependent enzyme